MANISKECLEVANALFKDNPYDGYVVLYKCTCKEDFKPFKRVKCNEYIDYISRYKFDSKHNYYYTINSFRNGKGQVMPINSKETLFGVNGIVIDVDSHNNVFDEKRLDKEIDTIINKSNEMNIPLPHFIVKSGRGMHIYYLIEPCSYKLSFLVEQATQMFVNFYKTILNKPFDLDVGATNNIVGLMRIPGTYNLESKTYSFVAKKYESPMRNINELLDVFKDTPFYEINYNCPLVNVDRERPIGVSKPNIRRCQKVLKAIEEYQGDIVARQFKHQNRNRTCFVYASFLLHLYSYDDSFEKLKHFNSNYSKPLPHKRLIYILDYCCQSHSCETKSKYLYLTNKMILDYLDIKSGDYNIVYTKGFEYKDLYKQTQEKREKKRQEKKNREQDILGWLLLSNENYDFISKQTGASVSTISRIAKRNELTKKDKNDSQPWIKEGISRATYYRRKKGQ